MAGLVAFVPRHVCVHTDAKIKRIQLANVEREKQHKLVNLERGKQHKLANKETSKVGVGGGQARGSGEAVPTSAQKKEHRRWKAERERIDRERLRRHSRNSEGGGNEWTRELDSDGHKEPTGSGGAVAK